VAIVSGTDPHAGELAAIAAALGEDYVVECEIGRGGMGVVYRARDIRLDRLVALKVLPPNLAGVEDVRERFLREARTAARLAHPNIVPIHRADELGGYVFFVMGLVQGESLAERLRTRGPLAPAEVVPLLADVSRALAYAHAHGVVHRDIKPENILIDSASGRALVTDFGIARLAEASPLTATGQVLGTVYFMSPEQVSSDALDGRSDLYSLGVVGFVALSGHYPFDGATASAVLVAHVTKLAPRLQDVAPQIPDAVGRTIDRCLMRDPANRFPDGDSLARALDDARAGAAVQPARAAAPDVLSEREAMAVWQRAAELQALTSAAPAVTPLEQIEAARSRTQGYRIDHVRDAAVEAGISQPYVDRAVSELGFAGPLPARIAPPAGLTETPRGDPILDPAACNPLLRALIGGPTRLHVEATVDGEIADAEFEVLLRSIRRAMGDAGHMSVFARTLSWSSTGNERRVTITISSRDGRTTVTIGERLGPIIGGIFGGVGGGLGGGGSAGAVALAQKLLGNGAIGFALIGWLAATYGIARTIYSVTVKRRERRHHALLAELVSLVGGAAGPAPQLSVADTRDPRLLR